MGVVCIRPGSWSSRHLHSEYLQIYRHWWDDTLKLWFAVCDRPNALCIPHRYAWTPTSGGYWRWVMMSSELYLNLAIAANGLVVYDEKGPVW